MGRTLLMILQNPMVGCIIWRPNSRAILKALSFSGLSHRFVRMKGTS
jgi:hypothetical protein